MELPQLAPDTLAADLARVTRGQIRFSPHDRALYSTDASLYQVMPIGVVVPEDEADLITTARFLSGQKVPILPRGGGTSLAGQCTNRAVVLDTSPSLRAILSVDVDRRICQVQPGLPLDDLNRALKPHGLFFAPDPATSAQATIGGCVGNNAAGTRSIKYGRTSESVLSLDVLLATGQRLRLGPPTSPREGSPATLSHQVAQIVRKYAPKIRERFPKTIRRNAGYALDALLAQLDAGVPDDQLNLAPLICGSEGTLAIVLSAELKLHPTPPKRGLVVACFPTLEEAINAVMATVATGPSAVELLDDVVLTCAAQNTEYKKYLDLFRLEDGTLPQALLYVEYEAPDLAHDFAPKLNELRQAIPAATLKPYFDAASLAQAWQLRKAAEPLLHALPGKRKPHTFVEDNAVPPEKLSHFVSEFKRIVGRHGTTAAYYAHASVGVLHVRPLIDLHDDEDLKRMRSIAVEVADLARSCGGVMSGEHGDGKVRGPLLERFYGAEIMQAFREIKRLFDPHSLLNPGNIVSPGPIESITQNLRIDHVSHDLKLDTFYAYEKEQGLAHALEGCNGAGVCRRTHVGAMCPSYRATLDERHSPRGRANALRTSVLSAETPDFHDEETGETLDLCLSCKACKTECPSNVDISKLKAEYTAQSHREEPAPLASQAVAHVRTLNQLGGLWPSLANAVTSFGPVKRLIQSALALAPQRDLPRFACAPEHVPRNDATPKVLLFADCFNTYNTPATTTGAIRLLEAFGYDVELANVGCCGRPAISAGQLRTAKKQADALLRALSHGQPVSRAPSPLFGRQAEPPQPLLFLEPSCASALRDDYLDLNLHAPKERREQLAASSYLVDEFLDKHWPAHPRIPNFRQPEQPLLLHIHCHQRALWSESSSTNLLKRLNLPHTVTQPTCCGLAGAFGHAAHRYDLSIQIANLTLTPDVNANPNAQLCAPGTSCREQIRHTTGRDAIHPVELLAALLA